MEDPTNTPKPYTIVKQEETTAQLRDGSWGKVMRVTFRTAGNVVLSVNAEQDQYTAEGVRALIEEKVGHSEAIANL